MKKLNIKKFAISDPGSDTFEITVHYTENYNQAGYCNSVTVLVTSSIAMASVERNGVDVAEEWNANFPTTAIQKVYTENTTETLTFSSRYGEEITQTIDVISIDAQSVIGDDPAVDANIKINPDIKIEKLSLKEIVSKILEIEDFMDNYGLVAKGNASTWNTNSNWSVGAISTSQILKENVIKFNSSESAFEFLQSGDYQVIVSGRFDDTASQTTSINTGVGIAIKTSSGTTYNTTDTNLYNSWQDNNYRLTGYFNRVIYIEAGTKIKPKVFSQSSANFKECMIQIIRLK